VHLQCWRVGRLLEDRTHLSRVVAVGSGRWAEGQKARGEGRGARGER